MKWFFGIVIVNILLVSYVIFTIKFSYVSVLKEPLENVINYNLNDAITKLGQHEIEIKYVESNEAKDVIIKTTPQPNEYVKKDERIILYVSKGYISEKYPNIINLPYESIKEKLDKLVNKYELQLKINYIEDKNLPDGLIVSFSKVDEIIKKNDIIELTIIKNNKYVVLPDFYGWYYEDVLNFLNQNDLKAIFVYKVSLSYPDYVIGQSIKPYEEVLKNSDGLIIYLAKEED